MSEDEVEKFEVTDYDLNNEFNINRSRRPTKDQQIYGIWADDSDEQETKVAKRSRGKKPKDYTTPIGFVAGGTQEPGKKKPVEDVNQDDEVEVVGSSSEEEDENTKGPPPVEQMAGLRRRGPTGAPTQTIAGGVGHWEKHTKGIGAKLLLQMGYQPGKGLGKSLQGMSAPITASLRKGRGAIGAYGPEVKMKKGKEPNEVGAKPKDEEEKSYQWKKTQSQPQRYRYRAADDVISEGKPVSSTHTQHTAALARVPVIDMRGPEKRVLSGYHALRAAAPRYEDVPRRECPHLALPELLHNLNLLVNMCEQDIIECAREGPMVDDRIAALERDCRSLEETMTKGDEEIAVMEDILSEISKLSKPELSLDDAHEIFTRLQSKYPMEYSCLSIGGSGASSAALGGLMASALASWRPLRDAASPLTLLAAWAPLLSSQALQELFWQPWLEQLNIATQEWDVREPSPMLAVASAWWEVAPSQEKRTWLRGALVPCIASAAVAWDPTADTLPLHHWVLPWHHYAGDLLEEGVYPGLRARLGQALQGWHPMDGSALALLRPWTIAWAPALPSLTAQSILPKLEAAMRTMPVEPDANPLECWGWCSSWQDILGPRALAGAAGRALLPRWLASLAAWLNRRPPHSHLIQHYSMWKAMFSDELHREAEFSETFRKALDMMNRSLDAPVPTPPLPPASRISTVAIAEVMASNNQQLSFTELLESRCRERGLALLPQPGRTREGRPLYRLGSILQCYVIRNVIMYSSDQGRNFQPISLDALLQLAMTQS